MLTWGAGDRVALLIHGMLGAASQFHQLGPGAGHCVWYGHVDEFMQALDAWLWPPVN